MCCSLRVGGGSSTSVLRAFRLLRVLKLARSIKSLRILLSTIMEVAQNVSYMALLLLLYVFMFAVLGMQRKLNASLGVLALLQSATSVPGGDWCPYGVRVGCQYFPACTQPMSASHKRIMCTIWVSAHYLCRMEPRRVLELPLMYLLAFCPSSL